MGSLLHFGVVGVHHVVIVLSGLSARSVLRTRLRSFGLLGVELLGQLVRGLGQFIHGLLDGVRIIPFHDLLQGFGLAFNIRLQRGVDVLAQIADGLLRGVDERIGAVADLDAILSRGCPSTRRSMGRVLRDEAQGNVDEIIVDGEEEFAHVTDFVDRL